MEAMIPSIPAALIRGGTRMLRGKKPDIAEGLSLGVGLTFGVKHRAQTNQVAMDYLTTDRRVTEEYYKDKINAYKKELQNKNLSTDKINNELNFILSNRFLSIKFLFFLVTAAKT